MDLATARKLARYNRWADGVMFDAVASLPEGEAVRPRTSLFKNMVHTLNHIYVINRIWQAHLEGRNHSYEARNTDDHPILPALSLLQQEVDAWYIAWADGQTSESLGGAVNYTLIGGNRGEMTRGEILLHVVIHASYHRGYVADMICELPDYRPPAMDLPVFMREGRAEVCGPSPMDQ
jgi:uncharacterized damage-inducible protein DinB